jgi:hypothetical protein
MSTSMTLSSALLALLVIGGCGGNEPNDRGEAPPQGSTPPDRASAAGPCDILTAEDVQEVTGTTVTRVERDASVGLGGDCANFVDAEGEPYLGVNRIAGKDYDFTVEMVPEFMYDVREPLSGLGDEAILLSAGDSGVRYLVARTGEQGVVLFPLGDGVMMSSEQLRRLAERALARGG